MDQKTQFIADYLRQSLSMSELCDLYGISRKTGYKLVERYLKHGPSGLEERSRKPASSPNHTPEHIVEAIIALRQRHPSWGAKKLLPILERRHPNWDLPGRSTVCDILSRQGLVPRKRNRRHIGHPGKPSAQILGPNDCWSADPPAW
jgi:transposase